MFNLQNKIANDMIVSHRKRMGIVEYACKLLAAIWRRFGR